MPMQAASLEVLERAKVPSPQARAIVQAIEIEIAAAGNTLATKQDITLLRQDIIESYHRLELKIGEVDKKVDVKFAEVDVKFAEVDVKLAKVDVKLAEIDKKVDVTFAGLETKIVACGKDTAWKVIGTLVALFGLLLGAMYFFVSHVTLESVHPQPAALSSGHPAQPVNPAAVPAPRAPPKPQAKLTPLSPFPAPAEPAAPAVP